MSGTFVVLLLLTCAGVAPMAMVPPRALAQAATDSTLALSDSLTAAAPDSARAGGAERRPSASPDSLSATGWDSLASAATEPYPTAPSTARQQLVESLIARHVSESLEDVIELLLSASVRVEGDRGMPAFLSVSPLSGHEPEIYLDGVPSVNPADRDPALWDLPVLGLASAGVGASAEALGWGPPQVRLETEGALEGRARMRTQFSTTADETFYRAVSIRTPKSAREIRFDYGEWKTEEGALFSRSPAVFGRADAGRTKIRHFLGGADLETGAGRLSLRFGRGTRFHRGTVASNEVIERWSGRLSMGLDRASDAAHTRVRFYHLDWHVDDRVHADQRDASRLGLRFERRPRTVTGWAASLEAERQAGRFQSGTTEVVEVEGFGRGRASLGLRWGRAGGWSAAVTGEAAYSEQSSDDIGWGGRARLGRDLGPRARSWIGAERRLRDPTMVETSGWVTFETVQPTADGFTFDFTTRRPTAAGRLPFEVQERAVLGVDARFGGFVLGAGLEAYRLREGIGWEVGGPTEARTVGGLELDVEQVQGFVYRPWDWWGVDFFALAAGHRVLSELERDASRGAGWPLYASRVQVGAARDFFAPYNRIGFDLVSQVLGPRFDDRLAPVGSSQRQTLLQLDLQLWLRVRDAELRLAWDNLLDEELDEVLGTRRRPRQMRLSLKWDFYN